LVALAIASLFVLFIVESGARVVPALSWTNPQGLPLLLILVVAVAGVLLAWRWEAPGGAIAVVSALLILALVLLGSGPRMMLGALFFTLPLLAAGCLYLGCWWQAGARRGER
jgi:hypothetical protein